MRSSGELPHVHRNFQFLTVREFSPLQVQDTALSFTAKLKGLVQQSYSYYLLVTNKHSPNPLFREENLTIFFHVVFWLAQIALTRCLQLPTISLFICGENEIPLVYPSSISWHILQRKADVWPGKYINEIWDRPRIFARSYAERENFHHQIKLVYTTSQRTDFLMKIYNNGVPSLD